MSVKYFKYKYDRRASEKTFQFQALFQYIMNIRQQYQFDHVPPCGYEK